MDPTEAFQPLGEKASSAQLSALYRPDDLVGRLVIAATNLGTRNIAGFTSEVLVLGHRSPLFETSFQYPLPPAAPPVR